MSDRTCVSSGSGMVAVFGFCGLERDLLRVNDSEGSKSSKSSKVWGVGISDGIGVGVGIDVETTLEFKTDTETGLPLFFGVCCDDPSGAAFLFFVFFRATSGAFW